MDIVQKIKFTLGKGYYPILIHNSTNTMCVATDINDEVIISTDLSYINPVINTQRRMWDYDYVTAYFEFTDRYWFPQFQEPDMNHKKQQQIGYGQYVDVPDFREDKKGKYTFDEVVEILNGLVKDLKG